MEYTEAFLPSGRAVRVRRLSTRDKLAIDDRVEKKTQSKGSSSMTMLETAMTCLAAYTEPRTFVRRPVVDSEGRDTGATEIDVDATFSTIQESDWYKTNYVELNTDGPKSLVEVFSSYIDFSALLGLMLESSGKGAENVGALAGKARQRAM